MGILTVEASGQQYTTPKAAVGAAAHGAAIQVMADTDVDQFPASHSDAF